MGKPPVLRAHLGTAHAQLPIIPGARGPKSAALRSKMSCSDSARDRAAELPNPLENDTTTAGDFRYRTTCRIATNYHNYH